MKFTDGFWLVKKEFEANFIRDIYDVLERENEVVIYAPYKKINGRADTLNLGLMTIYLSCLKGDIIKVRLANHLGKQKKAPAIEVAGETVPPCVEYTEDGLCISSGRLSLEISKTGPVFTFKADGEVLTSTSVKGTSYMRRDDGRGFLVTELGLGVGELVYGLGERFTPYVKNGQNVDIWNEDGGTSSEKSYKNIPFYYTNKGYGVFVDHPGCVSFEVGSEKVESVQFSVEDEELNYYFICGPTQKDVLRKYSALTGRAPLLPKWSFGLWLTTSFTTDYNEITVNSFIEGMAERDLPLHAFHFDCFWMKGFEWCNFEWDEKMFPDPVSMIERLHKKGLRVCLWTNPYIAQKSPLFEEGVRGGYFLKRPSGDVWQWDMWQAGMALVDFTNPEACKWYAGKLKRLLDMGVDCFKSDFGERIPTDVEYFDNSDPVKMHNYYTHLFNKCIFDLLVSQKGEGEAILFARSATVGGQKYPVHWGGDNTSQFVSMAESLRGGLSLMDSGFAFWSHDIGGFEDNGSAALYKRWIAFGMLSSHSRLHGSTHYRVPWNYDDEACDVLRFFTKLKCRLMPYIYTKAIEAHLSGISIMRPMHLEFGERGCEALDRQYMLGESILVAPVFSEDGKQDFYLPEGQWTHMLTNEVMDGGWKTAQYDFMSLPLFARENACIPIGKVETSPDYDYADGICFNIYGLTGTAHGYILDTQGKKQVEVHAYKDGNTIRFEVFGGNNVSLLIHNVFDASSARGCETRRCPEGTLVMPGQGGPYEISLIGLV